MYSTYCVRDTQDTRGVTVLKYEASDREDAQDRVSYLGSRKRAPGVDKYFTGPCILERLRLVHQYLWYAIYRHEYVVSRILSG